MVIMLDGPCTKGASAPSVSLGMRSEKQLRKAGGKSVAYKRGRGSSILVTASGGVEDIFLPRRLRPLPSPSARCSLRVFINDLFVCKSRQVLQKM